MVFGRIGCVALVLQGCVANELGDFSFLDPNFPKNVVQLDAYLSAWKTIGTDVKACFVKETDETESKWNSFMFNLNDQNLLQEMGDGYDLGTWLDTAVYAIKGCIKTASREDKVKLTEIQKKMQQEQQDLKDVDTTTGFMSPRDEGKNVPSTTLRPPHHH